MTGSSSTVGSLFCVDFKGSSMKKEMNEFKQWLSVLSYRTLQTVCTAVTR